MIVSVCASLLSTAGFHRRQQHARPAHAGAGVRPYHVVVMRTGNWLRKETATGVNALRGRGPYRRPAFEALFRCRTDRDSVRSVLGGSFFRRRNGDGFVDAPVVFSNHRATGDRVAVVRRPLRQRAVKGSGISHTVS